MNCDRNIDEREAHILLDQLVCGELEGLNRRRLLTWLEHDPARWRLCGLAFVEAQAWSQGLSAWMQPPGTPPAMVREKTSTALPIAGRASATAMRAVVAACIVAAFVIGASMRDLLGLQRSGNADAVTAQPAGANSHPEYQSTQDESSSDAVLASVAVKPGSGSLPTTSIRIPVVPRAASSPESLHTQEFPEYVRQQWEKRGFRLDTQRRYVLANLPGGEPIAVPVEQVLLSYVGGKVY